MENNSKVPTPGPWKWGSGWQELESDPRDFRKEFTGPKYADLSLRGADNKTIIGIGIDHWNIEWDSKNELADFTNADRALIAAAPELLNALKGMQIVYAEYVALHPDALSKSFEIVTDMVRAMNAAISKAEGK